MDELGYSGSHMHDCGPEMESIPESVTGFIDESGVFWEVVSSLSDTAYVFTTKASNDLHMGVNHYGPHA